MQNQVEKHAENEMKSVLAGNFGLAFKAKSSGEELCLFV